LSVCLVAHQNNLGKVSIGVVRESQKLSGHSYITRIAPLARSSLREHSFLVHDDDDEGINYQHAAKQKDRPLQRERVMLYHLENYFVKLILQAYSMMVCRLALAAR